MNKKINTNIVLKDFKGGNLIDQKGEALTLGVALGTILTNSEEGGKYKLYTIGSKLASQEFVELDGADYALVLGAVKNTKIYNALVAGQCEGILEEIKNEQKEG